MKGEQTNGYAGTKAIGPPGISARMAKEEPRQTESSTGTLLVKESR